MAVSFIRRTASPSATTALTITLAAVSHAAGNLLVVGVSHQTATPPVISNTAGDTWTMSPNSPQNSNGGANYEFLFYTITAGNASDVVTITTANGTYKGAVCYEAHTTATWATPALITDLGGQGATIAMSSGSLTFSVNAIVIAQMEADGGSVSGTNGYTAASEDAGSFLWDMYHVANTSEAATGNQGGNSNYGMIAGVFGETGGGGASTQGPLVDGGSITHGIVGGGRLVG